MLLFLDFARHKHTGILCKAPEISLGGGAPSATDMWIFSALMLTISAARKE